jgi:DNA-binding FadR family transcriptional regulator
MATLAAEGSRSLVAKAMDEVKTHIRVAGMRVGDTLPGEGYFAEKLGVSRAVMREAFGALAALKVIDVANGRRAKVAALDGSVIAASLDHGLSTSQIKVADVWDVRRTIEMRTASLAARNATPVQAARIVALAEAMGKDEQPHEQTTEDDIDFHLAIAEASGNALFNQIVVSFVPLMRVAVPQAWSTRRTADERRDILERHRRLAWAIADHDSAAAEQAMAAHFDEAIGALLR